MSDSDAGSYFSKHVGKKGKESTSSYPPSLSSAPVTPSSTAPKNTKLLTVSIWWDPAPLFHTPKRDVSYSLRYRRVIVRIPVDTGYDFPAPW